MAVAFDTHAPEILAQLEDPTLLIAVTRILVNGNHRVPDSENMYLAACSYFNFIPNARHRR
jgi:hypothetical protein